MRGALDAWLSSTAVFTRLSLRKNYTPRIFADLHKEVSRFSIRNLDTPYVFSGLHFFCVDFSS